MISMTDVTHILNQIEQGDPAVSEQLCRWFMKSCGFWLASLANKKPGQTLPPTALVHEAYLRMVGSDRIEWDSRAHFFSAAAESM